MHKANEEVAAAMQLGGKEEACMMQKFLEKGNATYNFSLLRDGSKREIVPKKRTKNQVISTTVSCTFCKQFFNNKYVKKHLKHCKRADGRESSVSECFILKLSGQTICQEQFVLAIRWPKKHDKFAHRRGNISTRLKELEKLVDALKEQGIKTLEEALQPNKYDCVVKLALMLGQWDGKKKVFGKPQVPKNLGHSINKCNELLKHHLMKTKQVYLTQVEFKSIMSCEWNSDIRTKCMNTIDNKHYNKKVQLPTIKDIKTLSSFLLKEQDILYVALEQAFDKRQYQTFLELVLVYLIQFNRRRPGEISRLKLAGYRAASEIHTEGDIYNTSTDIEKANAQTNFYIELPGKNNQKLGVIVPERQKLLMDFLIERRKEANILGTNEFVFANNKDLPINPGQAFARYADKCGAESPHLLRLTLLRKQVAIHAAHDLNLRDHEINNLAEFLGHSADIHKRQYRLSGRDLHLAKIQPVLQAVQAGSNE